MVDDLAPFASEPQLDGPSAVAILLMLLDEESAADILSQLDPDEVKRVGSAMFESAKASEADISSALDKFVRCTREVSTLAIEPEPRIRNVLERAVGNVRAGNILDAIAPQRSAAVLERLRWMRSAAISRMLQAEHPQVAALILAVLTPEAAAAALNDLSAEHQADLLRRAASLASVNAAAIADLEQLLLRYDEEADSGPSIKVGGASDVAKVVNSMPRPAGERILKAVKKQNRLLGQEIEDEMFVFDHLVALDDRNLGAVFRAVEATDVTKALKGTSVEFRERVLATMSARAAQIIRDELAEMGPLKREDVDAAQRAIVAVARALVAAGELQVEGAGDEYV